MVAPPIRNFSSADLLPQPTNSFDPSHLQLLWRRLLLCTSRRLCFLDQVQTQPFPVPPSSIPLSYAVPFLFLKPLHWFKYERSGFLKNAFFQLQSCCCIYAVWWWSNSSYMGFSALQKTTYRVKWMAWDQCSCSTWNAHFPIIILPPVPFHWDLNAFYP